MKAYAQQLRPSAPERDRLIAEHVEVARRISMRMARRCPPWVSSEDLVSAAMVGLAEAADRYDASRPEPFVVYAEKRIRGAVLDELRRGDIMPRRLRQQARQIGRTIDRLEQTHGAPPSDETIAAELGVTVEQYREELEQLVHVTISPLEEDDPSLPRAASGPDQVAERRQLLTQLKTALAAMDERDRQILVLYYQEELTYHDIAEVLGVTVSRVCQLHGRAIARLRTRLEALRQDGEGGEVTRG